MLFSRGFSRIQRSSFNGLCRCFLSHRRDPQFVAASAYSLSLSDSTQKIMGCREFFSWGLPPVFHVSKHQIHQQSSSMVEEPLDPFSLVSDELSIIANRLRAMVVAEVPKLASAAEYFFKMGVEGKRFRPTVLLLMSTALNITVPEPPTQLREALSTELRARQQCIAEVTEMIHVASLLHDDVLDDADTRRGVGSLNCVMGNKLAVLAGDFLLSRACVALASLRNTEVVSLLSTVVEHLVTGETMQMTTTSDQRCRYTALLLLSYVYIFVCFSLFA
ncbi:hypothetical protein ACFX13_004749 [Malus domestica]